MSVSSCPFVLLVPYFQLGIAYLMLLYRALFEVQNKLTDVGLRASADIVFVLRRL